MPDRLEQKPFLSLVARRTCAVDAVGRHIISAAGGTDYYVYSYLVLPSADILFLARKGINGAGAPCYKVGRKGPSPKTYLFSKSLIFVWES